MLTAQVAETQTGPSIVLSFTIAGLATLLAGKLTKYLQVMLTVSAALCVECVAVSGVARNFREWVRYFVSSSATAVVTLKRLTWNKLLETVSGNADATSTAAVWLCSRLPTRRYGSL